MRRLMSITVAALAVAWILTGTVSAADFTFGFQDCPSADITGNAGEVKDVTTLLTLDTKNNTSPDGAQGWSLGVLVTGATFSPDADVDFTVTDVHVSTIFQKAKPPADPINPFDQDLGEAGFVVAEAAADPTDPTKKGVVSAIVLNTQKKEVLQPNGTATVAKLTVHATVPATVDLKYVDGLVGSGQPVGNVVTYLSTSNTPALTECTFNVKEVVVGGKEFIYDVLPETDPVEAALEGGNAVYKKSVSPGDVTFNAMLHLTTKSLPAGDGPQGWSLSLVHEPCVSVADDGVTVEGVVVSTIFQKAKPPAPPIDPSPLDLADAGFSVAEVAVGGNGGPLPADAKGVVSAIVLNTQKKQVLHANATDPILKVAYKMTVAAGANPDCKATFQDGLVGSGQPVGNVITYNSTSQTPTTLQGLIFRITGAEVQGAGNFIRGDANDDGKVNIADAVWIVYSVVPDLDPNHQYGFKCPDAGDANDDGQENLADAIYIIDWQFRGSQQPPKAPFPTCGQDTTGGTADTCPKGSTSCP